jgi:hypothetical protein
MLESNEDSIMLESNEDSIMLESNEDSIMLESNNNSIMLFYIDASIQLASSHLNYLNRKKGPSTPPRELIDYGLISKYNADAAITQVIHDLQHYSVLFLLRASWQSVTPLFLYMLRAIA